MPSYRICLYVDKFPTYSETFILDKYIMLKSMSYKVVVVSEKKGDFISLLKDKLDNIEKHSDNFVYMPCSSLEFFMCFLKKLIQYPLQTLKFTWFNFFVSDNMHLSLYEKFCRRVVFIGLYPDLVSAEFDTLAIRICDIAPLFKFKLLLNVRGVAQCTNTYYKTPDIFEYISKFADAIVCVSEFLEKNLKKVGYSEKIATYVIYAGVDPRFLNPKTIYTTDSHSFRVTSIGRLAWSKGYEYSLEAISLLKGDGVPVKYTVIGEGPHWEAIKYASEEFNLLNDSTVRFLGKKSPSEVVEYLKETDVLLQASVAEGFGISTIEAQAMEIPVVGTYVGGLPEAIEDKNSGYLVSPRNAIELYEKLLHLYKNTQKMKTLGLQAGKRIAGAFTREIESKKWEIVLESILNKS